MLSNALFNVARPKNQEVIRYFVETAHILNGDKENAMVSNNTSISGIVRVLNINENELKKCNKKTSTATARSIMKLMYPNLDSNFRYTNIDKSIIHAITSKLNFLF